MMSTKLISIKSSLAVAKLGEDFRSKILLFAIKILNHIDHRRIFIRAMVVKIIKLFNPIDEFIRISLRLNASKVQIKLRFGDYSDYQSLGECLGEMYEVEVEGIKYFIDGGANIGFFSLKMLLNNKIKMGLLIEPNQANLDLLRFNIQSINHYTILPFALSSKEGDLEFELATSNTGHLSGSIGHPKSDKTVIVKSKSIMNVLPKEWPLDEVLLKLDIEGAEYEVIQDLIDNRLLPKIILAEIHDYLREGGEKLVNKLIEVGYSVKIGGSGDSGNVCRQISAILEKSKVY